MRRPPDTTKRFIANTNSSHYEVHDLDKETTNCQIDELMAGGNYEFLPCISEIDLNIWFQNHPDYDGCYYCLNQFHRK